MVFDIGIDATYVHSFCVYFLVCDNYKIVAGRFEVLYFRVSSLISSKNCNQTISSRWDWLFRRPTTIPQKSPVFWSMAHCRWQSQLSLLLEVLQDWVDILKSFIDFCSHLKPTMIHQAQQHGPSITLAPVRTTLPETNMRRTIRGFTILTILDINQIFNVN